MRLILLLFSPLFFTAAEQTPSTSPILFQFTETNGYTYSLFPSQVRAGYSSALVNSGFLVGKVASPNKPTIDYSAKITKIFADEIASNKTNSEKLSLIKKEITSDFEKLQAPPLSTSPSGTASNTNQMDIQKLDWKRYETCVKKVIPFLKQSVVLAHKMQIDPTVSESYYLTKSLVDELSTVDGVACGKYLGSDLELQIKGETRNIKVIIAFLKRTEAERQTLLKTLVGAFSKKAPPASANQFAYYFARQFFTAAVTKDPIPTYAELNVELSSATDIENYDSEFDGISFKGSVVKQYGHIEETYQTGMAFINGVVR
jgi:hypothetical protein